MFAHCHSLIFTYFICNNASLLTRSACLCGCIWWDGFSCAYYSSFLYVVYSAVSELVFGGSFEALCPDNYDGRPCSQQISGHRPTAGQRKEEGSTRCDNDSVDGYQKAASPDYQLKFRSSTKKNRLSTKTISEYGFYFVFTVEMVLYTRIDSTKCLMDAVPMRTY